eukprot:2143694-Prymnesium_polylepis.1
MRASLASRLARGQRCAIAIGVSFFQNPEVRALDIVHLLPPVACTAHRSRNCAHPPAAAPVHRMGLDRGCGAICGCGPARHARRPRGAAVSGQRSAVSTLIFTAQGGGPHTGLGGSRRKQLLGTPSGHVREYRVALRPWRLERVCLRATAKLLCSHDHV